MTDYTPEQKQIVEEILSIKHTDYYRVLKVDKSANDVEIKKSYRKLAIKLHPDKNKHPKASEAFKVIAKAFEILGDNSKRKMYDMTGSDPDSRSGGGNGGNGFAAGSGFQGFPQGFQGFQGFPQGAGMGGGFNDDLFNMLFNMGAGGNNGFSFQFGGNGMNGMGDNGFFFTNPGMNARRRANQQHRTNRRNGQNQQQQQEGPKWLATLIQFIPLLIIFFSMFMNFLSGGSDSYNFRSNSKQFHGKPPVYQYTKFDKYEIERLTPKYNIPYYIDENTLNDFNGRKDSESELSGLDKYVENKYIEQLQFGCKREMNYKKDLIDGAKGILFNDWETIKKAESMELPHCQRLEDLNLL